MSISTQGTLPDYPLVYSAVPVVNLAIVYNPFDISEITRTELTYRQSATLADYMAGLPDEAEWNVAYNGEPIERALWGNVVPAPHSNIALIRVPEGGSSTGKNVMRVVALIAVMSFAMAAGPWLAGALKIGTAATATTAASFGFTMAAGATTAAIGLAGALAVNALLGPKAPKEESPSYGIDGAKTTAREGVVTPVVYGDFRVGGNITDLFTRNRGIEQYLYMRVALNDGEVEDITDVLLNEQPVENFTDVQLRKDLGGPNSVTNDWFGESVRMYNRATTLDKAYVGDNGWLIHTTAAECDRLRVDTLMPEGLYFAKDDRKISASVRLDIQYRRRAGEGVTATDWSAMPLKASAHTTTQTGFTDSSSKPKRMTYESPLLERARYDIRVRRSLPDDVNERRRDDVMVTDFGEIDSEPTNMNGTANISLCIKMTDQLSGIPNVTSLVKGSKVYIYDADGNVVDYRKSSNPADIAVDILTNPNRGAGYGLHKVVWPQYVAFREHNETEAFTFNGVFDTVESLWDTVQTVASVGRGSVCPRGTKFGFLMDRQADPVMVFTGANTIKDSFSINWLAINERANEIQLQFSDKDDNYKPRTVRITDNAALARGDQVKTIAATGMGITSVEDALRAAEFAARVNRYLLKTVELEAPIEAIGLGLGDVALIQHESINFKGSLGGRLKAGSSTTSLNLDAPATMVAGKNYACIVVTPAVKRYDINVDSVSRSRLTVSGIPDAPGRVVRIKQGAHDLEVLAVQKVGSSWRITLAEDGDIAPGPAELWDVDVVEERDVVLNAGQHSTISLVEPLSVAPGQFFNYLFGEKVSLRQPFRLTGIKGSDVDRRTLSFVQYDERVYLRGGFETIEVKAPVVKAVPHVKSLIASYDRVVHADRNSIPVMISWEAPASIEHAGADVYVNDGDSWSLLATVRDASVLTRDFERGYSATFRVVAYDQKGNRAPFSTAPEAELSIAVQTTLPPPVALDVSVPYFWGAATARLSWAWDSADVATDHFEVQMLQVSEALFDETVHAIENPVIPPPVIPGDPTSADPAYVEPPAALIDSSWQATTTPAQVYDWQQIRPGHTVFRVRAVRNKSYSRWVYATKLIEAPLLPRVTGLKLEGVEAGTTFLGKDAHFTWDDIVDQVANGDSQEVDKDALHVWTDYRVVIKDTQGNVLRVEHTRSPSYTYTFEQNVADTAPIATETLHARRAFSFEVAMRSQAGQVSDVAVSEARNPPPELPAATTSIAVLNARLIYSQPSDVDFAGLIVYADTDSDPKTLVFDGTSTPSWPLPVEDTSYYKYAAYDVFDRENLVWSSIRTLEASPPIFPQIPDFSEVRDDLQKAVETGRELRDQLKSVVVNQMQGILTGVRQAGERDRQDQSSFAQIAVARDEIQNEAEARTRQVSSAISAFNDGIAGVNHRIETEASELRSATQAIEQSVSALGDNLAAVEERVVTSVDDLRSETARTYTQVSEFDDFAAAATGAIQTVADRSSATAAAVDLLGVVGANGDGFLLNKSKVYVGPSETFAQREQAIEARFDGTSSSYLMDTANAAASDASAAVNTLTQMGATIGNGQAFQLNAANIKVTSSEVLSERLLSIASRLNSTPTNQSMEARFDQKLATAVGPGGALATWASGVYVKKDVYESSAQLLTEAIDGLSARASLAVRVGTRIGGIYIAGSQTSVAMEFESDQFYFVDPSTNRKTRVLSYNNGNWEFDSNIRLTGQLDVRSGSPGQPTCVVNNTGMTVYDPSGNPCVQLGIW